VAAHRSAPIAWRLSRFFEVGTYVAVAAAIVVGLFLGVRLLEQHSETVPVQSRSAPANTAPAQVTQATGNATQKEIASSHKPHAMAAKRDLALHPVSQSGSTRQPSPAAASQSGDDSEPEYVALMFCDPLSCSSDAQVVRMELPAAAATSDRDVQPLVADVVVGYDGVVRAMRIVE